METKNLGVMIRFMRTMLSNLKPRRTKIQINLTFYLDYGALRKEHLDTLIDFIKT